MQSNGPTGFQPLTAPRSLTHELVTRGGEGKIVETIPGWTHNITNIGDEQMVVMLWANEIFDPRQPETEAEQV